MASRAPRISNSASIEQETRIRQLEAEIAQQNQSMETERAAAQTAEAERQRRAGRVATIRTSPQGVLTPNANEAPALKAVLG